MFRSLVAVGMLVCLGWTVSPADSWAAPSVADALELMPVQPQVPFDSPQAEDVEKCTIKPAKVNGATAWIIRGPNGDLLRRFTDSDGDNVVDTWSYFRDGLEIYRDIDSDGSGKADQYRWFHGAGARWGIDEDEDGSIDRWKLISAEEVAEEVVEALRTHDKARFQRLVITEREIQKLELGATQASQLAERSAAATAKFNQLHTAGSFKEDSEFSDFGGLRPGMVPAGIKGSAKDVLVYESVWAMVRIGGEHQQLQLGTMINVAGAWKLIDGPTLGNSQDLANGFFFSQDPSNIGEGPPATIANGAPSEKMQDVLTELEKLDQQIASSSVDKKPALNTQRAQLLLQLANLMPNKSDKEQWLRQLADMLSAAAQDGSYPQGIEYLKKMEEKLAPRVQVGELSGDLLAYFKFHRMLAEYYGVTMADPKIDYAKAQAEWLEDLEAFVEEYPKSNLGAEALRQLAMGSEMSGDSEAAVQWYRQILENHPKSAATSMARGAVVRLTSEGKEISLKGTAVDGGQFDLSQHRGKAVLIQYWATSSETCKADHAVLNALYSKYGGKRLAIVGVNLDFSRDSLLDYLKSNRLPWKQLYEQGGFDSRLAHEMGVVTVPLMVLIDPQGNVVSTTIQAAELETELKKLF